MCTVENYNTEFVLQLEHSFIGSSEGIILLCKCKHETEMFFVDLLNIVLVITYVYMCIFQPPSDRNAIQLQPSKIITDIIDCLEAMPSTGQGEVNI